jgi:membrane-associated protease RseP (regulator of RpoE activity)
VAAGSSAVPPARPARTLDDLPAWREKMQARPKPLDCYHCHFVFDAERHQALRDGVWRPDMIWRWPTPGQVGLTLDAVEQERVVSVRADSPAARAGLRAGDRLLTIDGQRVLSGSDVSWALERARGGARALALAWTRGDARLEGALELAAGWEVGDALTLSWRPSKWQLVPSPGFGGPALSAGDKQRLGLAPETFALRVDYLVTWGPEARFGEEARRAGVRKGDVVLGVNGHTSFESHDHFQAWWRLNLQPGATAHVDLLRAGERRVAELTVLE